MRRALLAVLAVLGTVLGLFTAGTTAQAYWTASAQTTTSLAPAAISITANQASSTVSLSGAAGTAYAAVDFTNTGQAALTQLTATTSLALPFPSANAGFALTASHALVTAGTPCSSVSSWQNLSAQTVLTTPMPVGANARLCLRLTHSGSDSSMNGQQAAFTATATGGFGATSWQTAPVTSSIFATIAGAPTPEPSVIPQAACTVSGSLIAYISYSGAPVGTYGYTVGSPDATTVYGSTNAVGLSSGFAISFGNFNTSGPQSFFLVNIETRQVVAQTVVVNNNWGSISCGAVS